METPAESQIILSSAPGDRLIPKKQIGAGGFGEVLLVKWKNHELAMKRGKNKTGGQTLKIEIQILKEMAGIMHYPRLIHSGYFKGNIFLTMDLLGPNLSVIMRKQKKRRLSTVSICMIGLECIEAIELFHTKQFVHRDIKPANFLLGVGPNIRHIYLIDYGLSKKYTMEDISRPPKTGLGFRGTARYASINSHKGLELGRVDDLWSLLYMLVEFYRKILPWTNDKAKHIIFSKKREYLQYKLLRDMPPQWRFFLDHLNSLQYADKPDYVFLKNLLLQMIEERKMDLTAPYEWESRNSRYRPTKEQAYQQLCRYRQPAGVAYGLVTEAQEAVMLRPPQVDQFGQSNNQQTSLQFQANSISSQTLSSNNNSQSQFASQQTDRNNQQLQKKRDQQDINEHEIDSEQIQEGDSPQMSQRDEQEQEQDEQDNIVEMSLGEVNESDGQNAEIEGIVCSSDEEDGDEYEYLSKEEDDEVREQGTGMDARSPDQLSNEDQEMIFEQFGSDANGNYVVKKRISKSRLQQTAQLTSKGTFHRKKKKNKTNKFQADVVLNDNPAQTPHDSPRNIYYIPEQGQLSAYEIRQDIGSLHQISNTSSYHQQTQPLVNQSSHITAHSTFNTIQIQGPLLGSAWTSTASLELVVPDKEHSQINQSFGQLPEIKESDLNDQTAHVEARPQSPNNANDKSLFFPSALDQQKEQQQEIERIQEDNKRKEIEHMYELERQRQREQEERMKRNKQQTDSSEDDDQCAEFCSCCVIC
ncbi:MAG: putative protein serine/threonine kinase [Streblomastix strix]|uniref:non-specific serine/threonine protein kinase n=1 Tax=Streblomastix strix TaxID=222440 RepID=A0A5J4WI92_9EUKA|nr:MAG: putative protein serine/threonine kinase [Streblomastix strix]